MSCRTKDHLNVGRKLVYNIINRDYSVKIKGDKNIINFDYTQSTRTQERNEFPEEKKVLVYHFIFMQIHLFYI